MINYWIWCFCSIWFCHFNVANKKCHKQKWRVLWRMRVRSHASNGWEWTTHFIVELPQNRGRSMSFFICHSFFYYATFFPLKCKLKDIIIHFLYKISNDIIYCYQFNCWILPLLPLMPLMLTDITWYYWTNSTRSLKSMNPICKMSIDLSRI